MASGRNRWFIAIINFRLYFFAASVIRSASCAPLRPITTIALQRWRALGGVLTGTQRTPFPCAHSNPIECFLCYIFTNATCGRPWFSVSKGRPFSCAVPRSQLWRLRRRVAFSQPILSRQTQFRRPELNLLGSVFRSTACYMFAETIRRPTLVSRRSWGRPFSCAVLGMGYGCLSSVSTAGPGIAPGAGFFVKLCAICGR